MLMYTTANYSDIFVGDKPSLNKLLKDIPSKVVINILAILNSELYLNGDKIQTQANLLKIITKNFINSDRLEFEEGLKNFIKKLNGERFAIWGKRYILEFLKYEFLNYRDIDSINSTPQQEASILKAYLLIAEISNERDRKELKKVRERLSENEEFFFEKLVWPFLLNQFDTNNQVDPIYNFFKLLGFLKHVLHNSELTTHFKIYLELNGFTSIRIFMGSITEIIKLTQHININPENGLNKFIWIKPDHFAVNLENLSFNIEEFKNDITKQIDFKGLREKPLFKNDEFEYIILDIDYLNNKIYNGQLFDMYYNTNMEGKAFKLFPDFKTHISKKVSEEIIFRGMMKGLFCQKHIRLSFDDTNASNIPDCYIRVGSSIFLIEFKDYLFPGKIVDDYSFDKIKNHIDLKFILNEKKKNKGISQIVEQIKIVSENAYSFDNWEKSKLKDIDINIYSIIVHTNFIYQLLGINHYLQTKFNFKLNETLPHLRCKVEKLVQIDLQFFFELLCSDSSPIKNLENLLKDILKS